MSGAADIAHVVRQWVEKAEDDLTNAEHTLTLRENCPLGTVCFHAQQCAEKYLKALLVSLSIDFPKSHDLGELLLLIPEGLRPPLEAAEEERLTLHAVDARYPQAWGEVGI